MRLIFQNPTLAAASPSPLYFSATIFISGKLKIEHYETIIHY